MMRDKEDSVKCDSLNNGELEFDSHCSAQWEFCQWLHWKNSRPRRQGENYAVSFLKHWIEVRGKEVISKRLS